MSATAVVQHRLNLDAGHGRLYASGPSASALLSLPGASMNARRRSVELSLTLETLRAIRQTLDMTQEDMASYCTSTLLRWARAAGATEKLEQELHRRLGTGWRLDLPWEDTAGTHSPPFEHQRVMATVACTLDGSAFLCEMGTGKTRAALEAANYRVGNGSVHQVLVLCPRGVMGTWERETRRWAPHLIPVRLEGERKQTVPDRIAQMAADTRKGVLFILNYEVIYRVREELVAVAKGRKLGLVLDEGHKIRNPQASVTKTAMELARHIPWRLHMTGTPILNGAQNIWSQWYGVDYGVTFGANYFQFRREFFDEDRWGHDLTPKQGALDAIGLRMRRRGLRYRKVDCLDLPPKVYETQDVKLTDAQQAAYEQMAEELIAQLEPTSRPADGDEDRDAEGGGTASAANQLVSILRLMQITSGHIPNEEGEVHHFTPNPKLAALVELVEENIQDHSIIVWAWYKEDIRALREALSMYNPVVIAGGQKGRESDEAELAFQEGRTRLLVGNPASGGLGRTLTAASMAVYYSQNYSLENRQQSEDRCHRQGSQIHNRVTYVDLVCRDTVDEIVLGALRDKKEVADVVVDLKRHLRGGTSG